MTCEVLLKKEVLISLEMSFCGVSDRVERTCAKHKGVMKDDK